MRNLALVLVLVLGSAAAVGFGFRAWSSAETLPLYEVKRGRFLHRVEAEGILVAEHATVLGTPGGAREPMKIAWLATEGSYVEKDQVVVRFDPTDMEKELHGGESDRAKAEQQVRKKGIEQDTTLDNLERDAELADLQLRHAQEFQSTDEEIFGRNEIIESAIDEKLAIERKRHAKKARTIRDGLGKVEIQLLDLEKRRAQLAIDKAEAGLRELEVRAPHAGIFVLRRDWGEPPSIGQMVWPGMALAEIPELGAMKVQLFVLEADAGGVEVGTPVRVRLEAHPEDRIDATVRRVAAVAKRRTRWSPVQYFEVELQLAFTDPERMKPGQRVRATLLLQDLEDVISVPRAAVFENEQGDPIVYRQRGGGFEAVAVKIGPTGLGRAVIEAGLEAGDVIALGDPNRAATDTEQAPASSPPGMRPAGTGP